MNENSSDKNELYDWSGEKPTFLTNEFDFDSDEFCFLQALSFNSASTLLAAALADGKKIADLGIKGILELKSSHMLNSSTNLVIGEVNGESFVISQHVSSCDFIFFPKLNKVKIICHANIAIIIDILSKLKKAKSIFEKKFRPTLGGLIISHGRPSHYFYDAILGLIDIDDYLSSVSLEEKLPLHQISHCNFADLDFFLSEHFQQTEKPFNFEQLNENAQSGNYLFLKIGSFYDRGNEEKRKKLSRFDESFLMTSNQNKSVDYKKILELKNAGYLIVWHGVTTQKRRWVEQCEAIISLGNLLCQNGVKLCVVVDGWTFPLNPSQSDEKQVLNDEVAFSEIKDGLSSTVHTFSGIGKTPAEKLSIASLCDFHITNGGTGSIYISRMAKVPGILHISNKAKRMTEQSIHYNSVFIPEASVTDIESDGQREDFVSYSIEKKSFVSFALNRIAELFDIKIIPVDIGYSVNCTYLPEIDSYESNNDDPIIIFNSSTFFPALVGNCEIKIKINTPLNYNALSPKLYLDLGDGYSESLSLISKYNDQGEVLFRIDLSKKLSSIRFDPFSCKGRFSFEYALIKSC